MSGPAVPGESLLIENLRFEGATSSGYGYGGYAVSTAGTATIQDCIFENWDAGAVEACGDLTLRDSTIRRSGVFFSGNLLVVEDCLFEHIDYSWPAIVQVHWRSCGGPTTARITGNTFRNNGDAGGATMIGYDYVVQPFDLLVNFNLFVGNGGPAVAFAPLPVTSLGRAAVEASLSKSERTRSRVTSATRSDGTRRPSESGAPRRSRSDETPSRVVGTAPTSRHRCRS